MKEIPNNRLFKTATAFYSNVDAPKQRNLTKELRQTLAGYQETSPGFFALEKKFQPQYADLSRGIQATNLFGNENAPGTLEMGAVANRYNRTSDINDVLNLGPAATQGILNANPFLRGSLENLSRRTANTPILSRLNRQAADALNQGGELTQQDIRNIQQATRSGYSARGTNMGNNALVSEVLNQDSARRSRLGAAQSFASGVQGLNQAQNDFTGRASQIFSSTLGDPFMSILNRSSGVNGGGNQQIGTGARIFDPTNPYAEDIYSSNVNAKNAANIANTQGQNSTTNALIGLAGSLILSDRRAKKDVKRIGTSKEGHGVYRWRYRKNGKLHIGPIAQDIEKRKPSAVVTDPFSKVKMVDTSQIDVPLIQMAA